MFGSEYLTYILPALIFAMWAQSRIRGAFEKYSQVRVSRRVTGAQVAADLLSMAGISDVQVKKVEAHALSNYYDPRDKSVNLAGRVYEGRTVAALGIAAHETGHALQHNEDYLWLSVRNSIVPVTQFGSRMAFPLFLLGLFAQSEILINLGLLFFALAVVFQLVTLPVEFDASRRAKALLTDGGFVEAEELDQVQEVLNAAAFTYVASALMAVMQFVYLFSGRRR